MQQLHLFGFVSALVSFSLLFALGLFFLSANQAKAVATQSCESGFDRPTLFGIDHNYRPNSPRFINEAGGTTSTVDMSWDQIEPAQAQLDWSTPDYFVERFNRSEEEVIAVGYITSVPQWAAQHPEFWDKFDSGKAAGKSLPKKGSAEAAFESFVRNAAKRYKDDIKYWTYGNEPNGCSHNNQENCVHLKSSAEDYVYWMNIAYRVIHEEDPDAVFIGGNLEYIKTDTEFIKWMDDYGAQYDALGIHPYEKDKNEPLNFSRIQAAYDAQSNKRPIWLTEWGWSLDWRGMPSDKTEAAKTVAGYIEQAMNTMIQPDYSYIQGAIYMSITDIGDGSYGLGEEAGSEVLNLRSSGVKYQEIASSICHTGASATSPNIPPSDGNEIPVTIRTYYSADQTSDGQPVEVSMMLNNGDGYDRPNAGDPLYDKTACTSKNAGRGCGIPNAYSEKVLENFSFTSWSTVRDVTVNASELVYFPEEGYGVTKLSYLFLNDYSGERGNRNLYINKVEFYVRNTDGEVEKVLEYYPYDEDNDRATNSDYEGYPTSSNQLLQSFYFDMGDLDAGNKVKAFDKNDVKSIVDLELKGADKFPLTSEGSFNLLTLDLYKWIKNEWGGVRKTSCVIATNDAGDLPLGHNQSVTLTSVASEDVAKFTYAFYNLDNLNNNGNPKPFCVAGEDGVEGDGCPEGSGQLVFRTNNPQKVVQALSMYRLPNSELARGLWLTNQGWTAYSNSSIWKQSDIIGMPGWGEIHAQDTLPAKNGIQLYLWRDSKEYTAFYPYLSDGSGVDFSGVAIQEVVDLKKQPDVFPGEGRVIAHSSIAIGGYTHQFIWRQDGQELYRKLSLSDEGLPVYGDVANQSGHGFTATGRRVEDLPGDGKLQAVDFYVAEDKGSITETFWRGNQQYSRTIPINNGQPVFSSPGDYKGPESITSLPSSNAAGGLIVDHADLYKPDMNNGGKIPSKLQVNAWFNTESGKFIGNDPNCVTSFEMDNSIEGDFNNSCQVDLLDFNRFVESYEEFNCDYNLTGDDCYIDLLDFNKYVENYERSC